MLQCSKEGSTMATKLNENEIATRLAQLSGWQQQGDEIRKTFECSGFPAAIAFTTQVGFLAEAAEHHPDIDIRWRNVTLALSTHDAGGLTTLDFDLAAGIDAIAR
jgi:4a-hydroxytetrahydrobiopterin dehydratase